MKLNKKIVKKIHAYFDGISADEFAELLESKYAVEFVEEVKYFELKSSFEEVKKEVYQVDNKKNSFFNTKETEDSYLPFIAA